jgi:hypothetical protein
MCIVDLDVLLPGCASSTWGDKKQLCIIEAKNYVEVGLSADSNPYIAGTWTYQWFNEAFLEYAKPYSEC